MYFRMYKGWPAVTFTSFEATAPVASKCGKENFMEDAFVSLPISCDLAAVCWSKPAVALDVIIQAQHDRNGCVPKSANVAFDVNTQISDIVELDEARHASQKENTSYGETMAWKDVQVPSSAVRPLALAPAVQTSLAPLDANEASNTAHEAAPAPCDVEPLDVSVSQVPKKGLGTRAKTWFSCAKASAAEPKLAKPKVPKAQKARYH
jgi:hypothetical protein